MIKPAKRYASPRRVRAILEPIEVKPRVIRVGERNDVREHSITSRLPIYVRPAVRDVLVDRPTLGDQLRDAAAIGLERIVVGARELDGVLWDPEHPGAFWAGAACFAAVTIALTYFIVQLLLTGLSNIPS